MKVKSEIIADWLECCENKARNLTHWERSFLESVQDQFDRSGHLSEKQVEILERIYTEKVP